MMVVVLRVLARPCILMLELDGGDGGSAESDGGSVESTGSSLHINA